MKDKKIHLELLRIIAVIMVCFNHTSSTGFQAYVLANSTLKYILYFVISFITKAAVPLFFMISGALLIRKEDSMKTLYGKRILRMVIVLLAVSFLYYFQYFCEFDPSLIRIRQFWQLFLRCSISVPLWYLYAYLGMLIVLPLTRRLASAMRESDYKYLFFIGLGLQIFEMTFQVENQASFELIFVNQTIFFPLFGHYLENVMPKEYRNRTNVWKALGLMFLFAFANAILNYIRVAPSAEPFIQFYLYKGTFTTAVPIYMTVQYLCERHPVTGWFRTFVLQLGACCFGIYLIENNLRSYLYYPLYDRIQPIFTSIPSSFLCILCEIAVGFGIVWVLRLIKPLRKLI